MKKMSGLALAEVLAISIIISACGNEEAPKLQVNTESGAGEENVSDGAEYESDEAYEETGSDDEYESEAEDEYAEDSLEYDEGNDGSDIDDIDLSEDDDLSDEEVATDEDDLSSYDNLEDEDLSGDDNVIAELTDDVIYNLMSYVCEETGCTSEEIRYYLVDDFDSNGEFEGFFFVGEEPDPDFNTASGTVVYASNTSTGVLRESGNFLVANDTMFYMYNTGSSILIEFSDAYATAGVSYIYYVENGEIMESAASGIGELYQPEGEDDYCISYSLYDQTFTRAAGAEEGEYSGHTWKPYYFYYDESAGDLREYKGYEITEDELTNICGFNLAAEIRAAGFQISEIYRRDNGIVNVNYNMVTEDGDGTLYIDYGNANFDEKKGQFIDAYGSKEGTWKASDFGGSYLSSLL